MTDYAVANTINDIFRGIFATIDRVAYWLLGIIYEILFNVASADLFSNETIQNFYGRIQLIIGVFMIFRLAISIIQGIINPDTFTDKKSGFSNIITRIIFALVLLAVLTPINIPSARTEYEIQLNNNGLLFGTLYSLQNRILQNNTLGRLILGTNDNGVSSDDNTLTGADKQAKKLKQSADIFSATILKGFIRINMEDGKTDETNPNERVCSYIDQEVLDAYTAIDASPQEILSLVNASCEYQGAGFFKKVLGLFKRLTGSDRYVFSYMPIISTVVAVVFIFILVGEIITIAVRSVKLAVLRLIAPIPIISYIDPKSGKDGAFASWVKALTSTYIELFLHLAVIYFVIFLIQDMIVNGIVINTGTGIIGIISCIFIWIGLFFFIRQAPKFIKDVLGIKGGGSNIGLAGLVGGTAMLAEGGGLRGFALGAIQGTEASIQGANQGKSAPLGAIWNQNQDAMAKIRTGDKDAHGGVIGHMQDRVRYGVGEGRARELGIDRNALAVANYNKDIWTSRVGDLQREMDFAKAEYDTATDPTAKAAAKQRYEHLYDAYQSANTSLTKATKLVDNMEKGRDRLGITPRTSDIWDTTYRSARKLRTTDGTTRAYHVDDTIGDINVTYSKGLAIDRNGNIITDTSGDVAMSGETAPRATMTSDTKDGYTGLTDDFYPGAGGHGPGGPGHP